MTSSDPRAPYHAHIYFEPGQRPAAEALQGELGDARGPHGPPILFVGSLREGKVGPHPISQFEVHFHAADLEAVTALLKASGLRVLIHPLTDDDLADHTSLGHWIGEPLDLDLSVLDPPGINQGLPRFGVTDF